MAENPRPRHCVRCGRVLSEEEIVRCSDCDRQALSAKKDGKHTGADGIPYEKRVERCPEATRAVYDKKAVRLIMAVKVQQEQAIEAVREWWRTGLGARDLKNLGDITDCRIRYVPFWRVRANVSGTIDGRIYESNPDGGGSISFPATKSVYYDYEWTKIAVDARDAGIEYLRNREGEARPYGAYSENESDLKLSENDAFNNALKDMVKRSIESANLAEVNSNNTEVIIRGFDLVYYPFWIVKYAYSWRKYSATVDGVTGDVVAGRMPGGIFKRAIVLAGGVVCCVAGIWICLAAFADVFWFIRYIMTLMVAGLCIVVFLESLSYAFFGSLISSGEFRCGYRPVYKTKAGRSLFAYVFMFVGFGLMMVGFIGGRNGIWRADFLSMLGLVMGY